MEVQEEVVGGGAVDRAGRAISPSVNLMVAFLAGSSFQGAACRFPTFLSYSFS